MATQIKENKLRLLVKESVREAIGLEMMKLRALIIPYISETEQREVEHRYNKPRRKSVKSFDIRI